jgi:hypothetical protein
MDTRRLKRAQPLGPSGRIFAVVKKRCSAARRGTALVNIRRNTTTAANGSAAGFGSKEPT